LKFATEADTVDVVIGADGNTPLSEKISRYRLKGCDWKGLLELIPINSIGKIVRSTETTERYDEIGPDELLSRRAEHLEQVVTSCY
jgi:hypothetical protein